MPAGSAWVRQVWIDKLILEAGAWLESCVITYHNHSLQIFGMFQRE
jgi:hypothetical protein